jgi:hypothetical protein
MGKRPEDRGPGKSSPVDGVSKGRARKRGSTPIAAPHDGEPDPRACEPHLCRRRRAHERLQARHERQDLERRSFQRQLDGAGEPGCHRRAARPLSKAPQSLRRGHSRHRAGGLGGHHLSGGLIYHRREPRSGRRAVQRREGARGRQAQLRGVVPHGRGCNDTEAVGAAELTRKLNECLASFGRDDQTRARVSRQGTGRVAVSQCSTSRPSSTRNMSNQVVV